MSVVRKWNIRMTAPLALAVCLTAGCLEAPEQAVAGIRSAEEGTASFVTQEELGLPKPDRPRVLRTFYRRNRPGPVIPALKQSAVPQGLAWWSSQNWLLLSFYREDGKPSLLCAVDATTGQMVKAFDLYRPDGTPYTGHAGGIAVSRSHLWVASENHVHGISLSTLAAAPNGGRLAFEETIPVDTEASFATFTDGLLWVGEFAHSTEYPTDASHHLSAPDGTESHAWAAAYRLDEAKDLPLPVRSPGSPDSRPLPERMIAIPDDIQGMTVGKDKIRLSRSYGVTEPSDLLAYKNVLNEPSDRTVTIRGSEIPIRFLDKRSWSGSLKLPPMSEGIAAEGDSLYILFESGAEKYRSLASQVQDRLAVLPLRH